MLKTLFKALIILLKSLFKKDTTTETPEVTTEEPVVDVEPETTVEETVVEETVPEVVVVETLATIKEYQTMLKALGYYTLSVDGVCGPKTKLALYLFNVTFLQSKINTYSKETDTLLKTIYQLYKDSVYMTDDKWKYFKNFKKSEYKCPSGCSGYPHKLSMHIVMADQFVRSENEKSINISSGLRCVTHNNELAGSSKSSHHLDGRASDCAQSGKTAKQLITTYSKLPFVTDVHAIDTNYVHKTVKL